jgi:hypothetical protein
MKFCHPIDDRLNMGEETRQVFDNRIAPRGRGGGGGGGEGGGACFHLSHRATYNCDSRPRFVK